MVFIIWKLDDTSNDTSQKASPAEEKKVIKIKRSKERRCSDTLFMRNTNEDRSIDRKSSYVRRRINVEIVLQWWKQILSE